jgi:sugar phosphate isomerase/epimerase
VHIIRFTKFWASMTVQQMGERARMLGYDGLDLAVRDGHAINLSNVGTALGSALRQWGDMGLRCSLISAGPDLTDANVARPLFEAAAKAGVNNIKIGYFTYEPGADFERVWANAREALGEFAALSHDTGVRAIFHTHSGLCLGSNCAGLRHLLEGFSPEHLGAYVDIGHLAVNGEDVRMGLPMIRPYLAAIGAKDARHQLDERAQRPARYTDAFVLLGEGAAQVHDTMALLKTWHFDGPISIHTEYTSDPDVIATVGGKDDSEEAQALRIRGERHDLTVLRALLAS